MEAAQGLEFFSPREQAVRATLIHGQDGTKPEFKLCRIEGLGGLDRANRRNYK